METATTADRDERRAEMRRVFDRALAGFNPDTDCRTCFDSFGELAQHPTDSEACPAAF
jgi:hypothetical protein